MSIKIGDKCPIFKTTLQDGQHFDISNLIGVKNVVIFFYPKDFTPNCTKEVCAFRDNYEAFQALNCDVIGISSDSGASHNRFAEKHKLPYLLISDGAKKIQKQFGVPKNLFGLLPGRVTYIIDTNGIVRGIYNSQTDPFGHIQKGLELVKGFESSI